MDTRFEKLIRVLENKGWTMADSVDISSDWWFKDIIQLRSKWRPIDTNLYLTLMTDPQISDEKVVWCIGISTTIPDDRNFLYLDQITLNDIKKVNLDLFVDKINNLVFKK